MPEQIPPKGQTVIEINVAPVPHGTAVTVTMRSLTLGAKMKTDHKRAMLYAWRALTVELDMQGIDLMQVLLRYGLPEALEREIEDEQHG